MVNRNLAESKNGRVQAIEQSYRLVSGDRAHSGFSASQRCRLHSPLQRSGIDSFLIRPAAADSGNRDGHEDEANRSLKLKMLRSLALKPLKLAIESELKANRFYLCKLSLIQRGRSAGNISHMFWRQKGKFLHLHGKTVRGLQSVLAHLRIHQR
jgi:hypothetical protein